MYAQGCQLPLTINIFVSISKRYWLHKTQKESFALKKRQNMDIFVGFLPLLITRFKESGWGAAVSQYFSQCGLLSCLVAGCSTMVGSYS